MNSVSHFQKFMTTADALINSLSDSNSVQSTNSWLYQLFAKFWPSHQKVSTPLEKHVAIVLGSYDTFKNVDLSKIPSPTRKKIAEALETSLKEALEEFLGLLHNRQEDNQAKVQKWLQDNGSLFTKSLLEQMSKDQVLQFTALLAAFKPISEEEVYNSEEEVYNKISQNLPDYAHTYLNIINLHKEGEGIPVSAYAIHRLFPKNIDRNLFLAAMAHLINVKLISIKETFDTDFFNAQRDLLDMAPLLRYVDLRELDASSTNDFQEKLIKSCSNLYYLFVKNHVIEELPPLVHCKVLDCSRCTSLKSLEANNVEKLDCDECTSLMSLQANNAKELDCIDCCRLMSLQANNVEVLDCRSCTGLTNLQANNAKEVYCSECHSLTNLQANNAKVVHCSECHSLTSLKANNAEVLNCSGCIGLRSLPAALPRCRSLNCSDCPLLDNAPLPELPANANVISNSRRGLTKLNIEIPELAVNPRKFLLQLGEGYLLKKVPFPNVYYFENGQRSEAVDEGGVRRDFITRLMEALFLKRPEEADKTLPIRNTETGVCPLGAEDQQIKMGYRTLGRLFSLCYGDVCNFKIGEIFNPGVFNILKEILSSESYSDDARIRDWLMLTNKPSTIALLAVDQAPKLNDIAQITLEYASQLVNIDPSEGLLANFSDPNIRKKLREGILKQAKDDLKDVLSAIETIANEMKSCMTEHQLAAIQQNSSADLQNKIQGELSAQALQSKLSWPLHANITQGQIDMINGFLKHWIDEQPPDQLRRFVRAVTANTTLGTRALTMEVYNRDPQRLPAAHTCFFSLELTANCPDQNTFDAKMKQFLDHSLAGSGFQFA